MNTYQNVILLPFRLLWNAVVVMGSIWLEIIWLGFLFGSVVGVVLLLLFWIDGFVLPLLLLGFVTEVWSE